MNAPNTDDRSGTADNGAAGSVPSASGRAGRGPGRLTPWHWLFSVVAMAAAVAVVAGMGQPRPAAPASGVSVPVQAANAAPVTMSPVLVVSRGTTYRYDPSDGIVWPQGLPRGARAQLSFGLAGGSTVVVANDRLGRPNAYYLHNGHTLSLGPAETAVRSVDRRSVWLVNRDIARKVDTSGNIGRERLMIPAGCVLVGANGRGLIVTGASGLLPGHTWVVAHGRTPHLLVAGRALAITEHRILIARGNSLSLVGFDRRVVQRLPWPSALVASGPGSLAPDGRSYALIARTAGRERLVVGLLLGRTPRQPSVIPLDGGRFRATPAPVWVARGTVVAVRPDGKLVAYMRGRAHGWLLSDGPRAVTALASI